jgi:hypothetical protein
MDEQEKSLLDAVEDRLISTGTPLCPGCGMRGGKTLLNTRNIMLPCNGCSRMTTWRLAALPGKEF